MKRLFYILGNLKNELNRSQPQLPQLPRFDGLDELVEEIQQRISFSLEVVNFNTYIRLLDSNLIIIVKKYLKEPLTLSINSVFPIKRLSDILTDLENEPGFAWDYLIDVIKGFSFEVIDDMKFIRLLDYTLINLMQIFFPEKDLFTDSVLPIKSLLYALTGIEKLSSDLSNDPSFICLFRLIKEINQHIGFSVEVLNGMRSIRFLDSNLVSIVHKYFPREQLNINSVLPIKTLFYCLNYLEKETGFFLDYLIEVIKGFSFEVINGMRTIHLSDPDLISIVQKYFPNERLSIGSAFPMKRLFYILPRLEKDPGVVNERFINLVKLVKEVYKSKIDFSKFMMEFEKQIDFEYLPHFYSIGQKVLVYDNQGAEITDIICNSQGYKIEKNGAIYNVEEEDQKVKLDLTIYSEIIDSDGCSFSRRMHICPIESWEGHRKISELSIIPLSEEDEIYKNLVARGKRFKMYSRGHHFLQHSKYKGKKGRVIVDVLSGLRSGLGDKSHQLCTQVSGEKRDSVREEELFMCSSILQAYNIAQRNWSYVDIDHLSEISFEEEAFDKLVLDETTKDLIENLVTFKFGDSDDIVSEKSGGCSLLLHGPPGVGKTLTVEAISERLHLPLFYTNSGELGLTSDELEENLEKFFEWSYKWNAIILVDEADIFLEKRSACDIKRNALVGVFLRLLEYHQGVIFLTTNRVNCFDDAFQSRISLSLEYKEPDTKDREKLWRIFLNDNNMNINKLKDKRLSGREIKNVVKLATALAKKRNQSITIKLLESIICSISKGNKRANGQDANK